MYNTQKQWIDNYIWTIIYTILIQIQWVPVYEIISKVVSGVSWKEAFVSTLPKRKIFCTKDEENSMDCKGLLNDEQVKENKCTDIKSSDDNSVKQNTT